MHPLLRGVLALSLLSLLGGILWLKSPLDPAAVHLPLAIGILPLIFAATGYFTPVLTRSTALPTRQRVPVLLALLAGVTVVAALLWFPSLLPLAASLGLIAVLWQLWIFGVRAGRTLGSPHPGLGWYQGAFAMLMLALAGILLGYLRPQYWQPLRSLHLHLNLLGFVGLTAIGTLRVLLPTVAGFSDPDAARWLKRNLTPFLTLIPLLAAGAAWLPGLGMISAAILLLLIARWLQEYRAHFSRLLTLHAPAGSLLCAVFGLWLSLASGMLHATGTVSAQAVLLAWLYGFLLPLVSGAASHLLPIWLGCNPIMASEGAPARLPARFSLVRGLMFLLAAVLALLESPLAFVPALLALLQFLAQCVRLLLSRTKA